MNFDYIEINVINKYWKTLTRKDVSNIQHNKFIKKPYLENYIIKLSCFLDKDELHDKIIEMFECNKITNEELFLFINNNIELTIEQKKNIEIFLFNFEPNNSRYSNISLEIINYQVKYFRFYNTIIELLFDNKQEDNELYNFILIFIKNKNFEIRIYLKKNIKFKIFYYYLDNLFLSFYKIIKLLIEYKLFSKMDKNEILNLFLKNIFINWYNIYKKDILENKVNDKIKNYSINNNILSRILCLPNA
jgi:hypothetical protein